MVGSNYMFESCHCNLSLSMPTQPVSMKKDYDTCFTGVVRLKLEGGLTRIRKPRRDGRRIDIDDS